MRYVLPGGQMRWYHSLMNRHRHSTLLNIEDACIDRTSIENSGLIIHISSCDSTFHIACENMANMGHDHAMSEQRDRLSDAALAEETHPSEGPIKTGGQPHLLSA